MTPPNITKDNIVTVGDNPFIRLFDIQYAPGKHYFDASRRPKEDLVALKDEKEGKEMLPDAVSCFVIIETPNDEPRILLSYEFRYPVGRFLLGVPAGLIDKGDKENKDALKIASIREIYEETGIVVKDTDRVEIVNPCVFSTPGMSDESNALMLVVCHLDDLSSLTQEHAEGSEVFDGFALLTKKEALELLKLGRDAKGDFYSAFTWMALTYFATDLWKE